jgi:hypothetical protein
VLQLRGSIRQAVSALKAKGVCFQGDVINEARAGSFVGFEDPASWSYVEKDEGQYQPAKT